MYFTQEKLQNQAKEIRQAAYRQTLPLGPFRYAEGDFPGAEAPDFNDRSWREINVGETWGGYDVTAWFRFTVDIPESWRSKKLYLCMQTGPRDGGNSTAEALLYINGHALQGIDIWHETAWLPPEVVQPGRLHIALKAWSGVIGVPKERRLAKAELVWVDEAAERFAALAGNWLEAAKTMPEDDLRKIRLLRSLDEAFRCIDFLKPASASFYASVSQALAYLQDRQADFAKQDEVRPTITGVGHAHIDMAWLWRLRHTREKAARTFSTALHLMRQYPQYVFLHSSPQLYKFLKQDYPELYSRVKQRIAEGRWEVDGGMWVEADTNLTSGESLIRQLLFGKRFVREEFGKEMDTLWLPDVFGYSGALPQIMKKSGIRRFMTTKISWSQFNRFPYDTFLWRGLDGSEVLTHFVTTPDENASFFTYNGQLSAKEVKGIWENYRQKEVNDELLFLFGWGDGGGGPTREMLDSADALKSLPGIPKVQLGRSDEYFERLEENISGKSLPVWDGELYLELHRGTYTSQAANKRANRKAEWLFHDAEWFASLADILTGSQVYPSGEFRQAWEHILLNQFHDVLPGSSIRQVYEDSQEDYRWIQVTGEKILQDSAARLLDSIQSPNESLVVFNSLPWQRSEVVEVPYEDSLAEQVYLDGKVGQLPGQMIGEGSQKKLLLEVNSIPALGYQAYPLDEFPLEVSSPSEGLTVRPDCLENRFFRIELNDKGQIARLWDKRNQREVLPEGQPANVLQLFEDKPMQFDAWDIDIFYQEKMREITDLVDTCVEESGPLRGVLRLTWKFDESTIVQRLTIYRNSPRIDFRTQADWHEHQVLLKVAFPVAVRSTRATYDVQFGSLERPTHWNTSWDFARFETSAHKWVDLSEGNYGVALLNDCKYGHDVKDNVLRLTLIKCAIQPDPQADQGQHIFTYSLLPHGGDWRGEVIRQAYQLNAPARAFLAPAQPQGSLLSEFSLASVDVENVILETVKRSEDGEAWILRVYESEQCRCTHAHIHFGGELRKAVECDLMEEHDLPVEYSGNQLTFKIQPFEIKTFKVWF